MNRDNDENITSGAKTAILKDLRPVQPIPPRFVFVSAFLGACSLAAMVSLFFLKSLGWCALGAIQRFSIFGALATTALLLAATLAARMVPGDNPPIPPSLLMPGALVAFGSVLAVFFRFHAEPHFFSSGEMCFVAGAPYGIPAGFCIWLLLRTGALLSSRSTAACAGFLAGLVSTSVLEIHCPSSNLAHILVWHLGFPAIGAGLGVLAVLVAEKLPRARTAPLR